MVGNVRLYAVHLLDQISDALFTNEKRLENIQPRLVAQGPQHLRALAGCEHDASHQATRSSFHPDHARPPVRLLATLHD